MIDPRSCFIAVLDQILPTQVKNHKDILSKSDYFRSDGLLEVGVDNIKKKRLMQVIKEDPKADKELVKCFHVFRDLNRRSFFEGLFFTFTKDEVLTLPGITNNFYTLYTEYFFNVSAFSDVIDRNEFLSRITYPSVIAWFQDLSVRTIQDVRFRLTGKVREDVDVLETLKSSYKKCLHLFDTFTTTDPEKMTRFTQTGMFGSERSMYDVAFKASANMVKIAEMLLKHGSQDEDNFLESWGIDVSGQTPSVFEIDNDPDIEADLKLQMGNNAPAPDTDRRITFD